MYLYYEHHKDINSKIVLTELRFSSFSNGDLRILWKVAGEKMIFDAINPILKWPPLANYSYDPITYIWSYFGQYGVSGSYGEEVIKKIEQIVNILGHKFQAFPVVDLVGQIQTYGKIDMNPTSTKRMNADEFFYNHGTPAQQPALTKEQIEKKFTVLTGFSYMDKKSYRQAAMILHPDRNQGDGTRMSELNMLWQMWQKMEVVNV